MERALTILLRFIEAETNEWFIRQEIDFQISWSISLFSSFCSLRTEEKRLGVFSFWYLLYYKDINLTTRIHCSTYNILLYNITYILVIFTCMMCTNIRMKYCKKGGFLEWFSLYLCVVYVGYFKNCSLKEHNLYGFECTNNILWWFIWQIECTSIILIGLYAI